MAQEKLEKALLEKVGEMLKLFGNEIPEAGHLSMNIWPDGVALVKISNSWETGAPPVLDLYVVDVGGKLEARHANA